jgi:predicted nucleotidyltransferase
MAGRQTKRNPMRIEKEKTLAYLTAARARLAVTYGVRRIGVFGSVARGTSQDSGDLDILVGMDNPTFDCCMALKFEIKEHLGVPADLVLGNSLNQRVATRIRFRLVSAP